MALSETANLIIKLSAQNATQAAFTQVNHSLDALKSAALKVAGPVAAALAFKEIISGTREWGMQLDKLQDDLGVTASEASQLNYVARAVGLSADDVAGSFGRMAKTISGSHDEMLKGTDVFSKWGIRVKDSSGNILAFENILQNTRQALGQMPNGLQKSAAEMEIFGKQGRVMNDFLSLSNEEVHKLVEEGKDLGLVLDDAQSRDIENFNRSLNRMGLAFQGVQVTIGNALLPYLSDLLDWARQFIKDAMPMIKEILIPWLKSLFEVAGAVGGLLKSLWDLGNAVSSALFGVRALDGVVKNFIETARRIAGFIKDVSSAITTFAAKVKDKGLVGALIDSFRENFPTLAAIWDGWLAPGVGKLPKQFDAFGTSIHDTFTEGGTIGQAFSGFGTKLNEIFGEGGTVGTAFSTLGTKITEVKGWFTDTFGAGGTIGGVFSTFGTKVNEIFGERGIIGTAFSNFGTFIHDKVQPVLDKMAGVWGTLSGYIEGARSGLQLIQETIEKIDWSKIPLLGPILGAGGGNHVTVTNPAGVGSVDIPTGDINIGGLVDSAKDFLRDKFGMKLAAGGLVTGPTNALIGEAGPEMVIPLSKVGQSIGTTINVYVSGNVTESEDKLADMVGNAVLRAMGSQKSFAF
jgi:TP901 family phage tail tape measure protein